MNKIVKWLVYVGVPVVLVYISVFVAETFFGIPVFSNDGINSSGFFSAGIFSVGFYSAGIFSVGVFSAGIFYSIGSYIARYVLHVLEDTVRISIRIAIK